MKLLDDAPHQRLTQGSEDGAPGLVKANDITQQVLSITQTQRERLHGHPGAVVWITGLSGAGKSTIGNALEVALHRRHVRTYLLDGDNLRLGLNRDLGFSDADRIENVRRIGEVARLMLDAGMVVICASISPFARERQAARARIGAAHFVEVFVDTPLATCEARDPKGLYHKARAGQLANFTGISSPYEAPHDPDVRIDGAATTADDAAGILVDFLQARWERTGAA
jgi:adenylyl-sulfate kinase